VVVIMVVVVVMVVVVGGGGGGGVVRVVGRGRVGVVVATLRVGVGVG
jgi:hypothetical protein